MIKKGDKVRLVSVGDEITRSAVGVAGCKLGDVGVTVAYDAPHWVVDMRESQPTYINSRWYLLETDLQLVEAAP